MTAPFALPHSIPEVIFPGLPMPPSSNNAYINRSGVRKSTGKVGWWRAPSEGLEMFQKGMGDWALQYATTLRNAREWIRQTLKPGMGISLDCTFYFREESIFTKKGKPRKNDASNRLKALHDVLFEFLGVDDCMIFDGSYAKRVSGSDKEYANVRLRIVQIRK